VAARPHPTGIPARAPRMWRGPRPAPGRCCLQDPWYAAGSWVPELILRAGGLDVAGKQEAAVLLQPEQVARLNPELIVFAICGLGLTDSRQAARQALRQLREACPKASRCLADSQVVILDGGCAACPALPRAHAAGHAACRPPAACLLAAPPAPAPTAGVRVFSRPGPLLVASLEAMVEVLHGEAQGFGHAGRLWAPLTGGGAVQDASTSGGSGGGAGSNAQQPGSLQPALAFN